MSHATAETRRATGAFYTPPPVARHLVRHTLDPLLAGRSPAELRRLRVLDPACGDGALLLEAYRRLAAVLGLSDRGGGSGRSAVGQRVCRQILLQQLFGIDVDRAAVGKARRRLAQACLGLDDANAANQTEKAAVEQLAAAAAGHIRQGDALVELPPAAGPFDAVIGNPPYVNIRRLTQHHGPVLKEYFARHYRCARGAYDLYVLFLERACQLLRPGGLCGMIVPNKLAAMDYARPCRQLLLEQTTLLRIDDLSSADVFAGTGVYPYIVVWRKKPPPRGHRIRITRVETLDKLDRADQRRRVAQSHLSAQAGLVIHGQLDVESRVPTTPLGRQATVSTGTTGFCAGRIGQALCELDEVSAGRPADAPADRRRFEFIVSGNIDRYWIRRGDVRFMKRTYRRPVLPDAPALLSEAKRRLYRSEKIVLAGLTRRLEAAWDSGGLALGVQVYALTDWSCDPRYLLALLNSRLLSYLFQLRFRAKQLGGGYLAINKSQLVQLPIRTIDHDDRQAMDLQHQICSLVNRIHTYRMEAANRGQLNDQGTGHPQIDAAEREIDQMVYRLYDLSPKEIARIEGSAL